MQGAVPPTMPPWRAADPQPMALTTKNLSYLFGKIEHRTDTISGALSLREYVEDSSSSRVGVGGR